MAELTTPDATPRKRGRPAKYTGDAEARNRQRVAAYRLRNRSLQAEKPKASRYLTIDDTAMWQAEQRIKNTGQSFSQYVQSLIEQDWQNHSG